MKSQEITIVSRINLLGTMSVENFCNPCSIQSDGLTNRQKEQIHSVDVKIYFSINAISDLMVVQVQRSGPLNLLD